jgi:hypothetical protein
MPRVTMKLATRKRTETKPLTQPQAAPVSMARGRAAGSGSFASTMASPRMDPEKAMTDPTDKSMPPVRMTKVMPTARTVSAGTSLAIC